MKLILVALLVFSASAQADESELTDLCALQVKTSAKVRADYSSGGEDALIIAGMAAIGAGAGASAATALHIRSSIKKYTLGMAEVRLLQDQIIKDFVDFRKEELSKFISRQKNSTKYFVKNSDSQQKNRLIKNYVEEISNIKKKYFQENQLFSDELRAKFSDLESIAKKFDGRIPFRDPEAAKKLFDQMYEKAFKVTSQNDEIRRGRPRATKAGALAGGLVGALGTGLALTAAQSLIIQKQCGENISDAGAAALAPYVDASLLGGCNLSSKGAQTLAAMPDSELRAICEKFPQMGDIVNALHVQWMHDLAKTSLPDMDVECKEGGIGNMTLSPAFRGRTYTATLSRNSMKVEATAVNKEASFKYEVPFDSETGKMGTVQSEGVFSNSLEGLNGLDAKDFFKFRENHKVIPEDPFQRKRYDIGDSLTYLDGIIPMAKKICANSGDKKVQVINGTDGKK